MFEPSAPASHLTGGPGGPPGGSPPWGGGRMVRWFADVPVLKVRFRLLVSHRCHSLFACHRAAICPLSGLAWLVAVLGLGPMLAHAHAAGLSCAAVAVCVLGTSPGQPVVGVPQVPRLAASYRSAASAAQHGMPLGQVPGPPGPLGLMPCTVAAPRGRASLMLVLPPVGLAVTLPSRHKTRTVVPCTPAQRHGHLPPGRGG